MNTTSERVGRISTEAKNAVGTEGVEQTLSVRWVLISLSLAMLLPSLGTSIANVALPTLAQTFNASFQEVQWIVIAYLLATTVMIVMAGRLGDILGRRRVLLAGICLFTIASLLCGVAPTLWALIIARMMQGLAAAILIALTLALVREAIPKESMGRAMGLLGTISAIGTALGPSLSGVLIDGLGWRAIFLVMVPLGILNCLLAYRYLPIYGQQMKLEQSRFDSLGALLLGLSLASYALAVTVGGLHFNRFNIGLLVLALLGSGLFVLTERRVPSPLIRLTAFRNAGLSASLAMNALVATVMMTTLVVGPFYLSRALGLDETHVGIIMAIGPMISTMSGILAGRIVDRIGASFIVIVGLIEMTAGAFALVALPVTFGVAGYLAAIVVLTPGYQLFQAANNTTVMMEVPPDQLGVISGMLSLSRNLGLITGASVMGAVFAFASRTADIATAHPEDITTGMQITFAVAGTLIVVALIIGIVVRTPAKRSLST